ncbi:MAG: M48 family metalloprotease, partial [Cyanothece sp. SIO1E1]|nr:M48 family metalloprotease [Cyanothece sp. SIO1E1]
GLLHQLEDDEIAVICAAELGHLVTWDFALMSGLVLLAQVPYLIYWQVAVWGDRQQAFVWRSFAAGISSFSYGFYWVIRSAGLWLSRLRIHYSDRTAIECTGNPNGLTRALLKIAVGMAADVQQQGQTSQLLESFDVLMPVGHQTALTLGSTYVSAPVQDLLTWDRNNPYRHWLTVNNAHPLMGDRLQLLESCARYWKLDTQLDWGEAKSAKPPRRFHSWRAMFNYWQPLLHQGSPFFGIPIGLVLVVLVWLLGGILGWLGWYRLEWLYGDRSILKGLLLLGFGLGTWLRINPFFPDIRPASAAVHSDWLKLTMNPQGLPVHAAPVRLQGKLLGRSGMRNWLGQDLMLQTETGLVKLHYLSQLGPIGNLFSRSTRPVQLVGQTLIATGWFRRGATNWIDLEKMQSQVGKVCCAQHPMWSTILGGMAILWGIYIIYRGDF